RPDVHLGHAEDAVQRVGVDVDGADPLAVHRAVLPPQDPGAQLDLLVGHAEPGLADPQVVVEHYGTDDHDDAGEHQQQHQRHRQGVVVDQSAGDRYTDRDADTQHPGRGHAERALVQLLPGDVFGVGHVASPGV